MYGSALFWVVAFGLTIAVGALIVLAMVRDRFAGSESDASDVQVYLDQLSEVDRDVARGVLSEADAERVRLEISRRLLEADKAANAQGAQTDAPPSVSKITSGLVGAAILIAAFGIYLWIGVPGAGDQPLQARIAAADAVHATRPSQAQMEAQIGKPFVPPLTADQSYLDLVQRLRGAVAENPEQLQGQMLLAQHESGLGNFKAAHLAMAKVIALKGDAVTSQDRAAYIELLVLAVEGYVSPEAEAAIQALLEQDPRDGTARYYLGLMYTQAARPDKAFAVWNRLLTESRPGAPWIPPILSQIEEVATAAGERFTLPPAILEGEGTAMPGPTAEDMEAAGDMSAEDRQAMIQGMVEGLASRLADQGGSAEEWGRLINALGVLGDTERAQAIWGEAQEVFADEPDALEVIRAAARRAGVAE